jgi:phage FluMu gp28-like protein
MNIVATIISEEIIDPEKDITAMSAHFKNGSKIHALTSNPRRFRSKGGKIVLDEFAFHDDQEELWRAARPAITWGFPLRIISTYNGKNNKYFQFVQDVKQGKLNWSLHTVPITLAVEEGLADKIVCRTLTPA